LTVSTGGQGAPETAAERHPGEPSVQALTRIVFALLVLASLAAFVITQRLKHTPTPVQRFTLLPVFSPSPLGHNKQELFSFLISRSDRVTVTIVDSNAATVATVAHDLPLRRYTQLRLAWNGRLGPRANGALAPSGEYRVRIALLDQHREIFSPKNFRLILHPKHDHSL
jgi:hypothetical protein